MSIQDLKKKKLEEEHEEDTGVNLGSSVAPRTPVNTKGDKLVPVGTSKREILENGQRVMSLSLDPDAIKKLDTHNGKYRIYVDNTSFKGNDAFKRDYIEIDKNALNQLKPSEDGTIKILAYEKMPGGDITTKSKQEKELVIVKDTPEARRELVEKTPEVRYKGEEDLYRKEKVMNTPITPTLNFRDVYNHMSETEKGEIGKMNSTELQKKIEDARPELSKIEDRYLERFRAEITTPDKPLKMVDGDNQTHEVKYVGENSDGWTKFQKKNGEEVALNPYDAMQKVKPFNNEQLLKNSVRESVDNTSFSVEKGKEVKSSATTDLTDSILKGSNTMKEEEKKGPKLRM